MSIFIAIPAYGGLIHADFAQSLLRLVEELKRNEINHGSNCKSLWFGTLVDERFAF